MDDLYGNHITIANIIIRINVTILAWLTMHDFKYDFGHCTPTNVCFDQFQPPSGNTNSSQSVQFAVRFDRNPIQKQHILHHEPVLNRLHMIQHGEFLPLLWLSLRDRNNPPPTPSPVECHVVTAPIPKIYGHVGKSKVINQKKCRHI